MARDIECTAVYAHADIITSDHKPVSAHFRMSCPAPVLPLPHDDPESFPEITITSLRGFGLFVADMMTSDPYIVFHTNIDDMLIATTAPRTAVKSSTVNPVYELNVTMLVAHYR